MTTITEPTTADVLDLEAENQRLRERLCEYKALAAKLADRLQIAQRDNEAAYEQAYEAASGPHFCRDHPFGTAVTEPTLTERLDAMAAAETDPARRAAWRLIRRTKEGEQ